MLISLYRYLNILSLDVVAGAIICSSFLANVLKVQMSLPTLVVLGLTVWVIYTFDRLMDVVKNDHASRSERHAFHKKNFQPLGASLIAAIVLIALFLFRLPLVTVAWGAVLSCGVAVYFLAIHLINRKGIVHKELMIAIIYSAGLFVGPLSIYNGNTGIFHFLLFIEFACMALMNLLIFSIYDAEFDQRASFPSLIASLGQFKSHILIKFLFLLEIGLILSGFDAIGVEFSLILLLMLLPLALIYLYRDKSFFNQHYRWIGDSSFLLPAFYFV